MDPKNRSQKIWCKIGVKCSKLFAPIEKPVIVASWPSCHSQIAFKDSPRLCMSHYSNAHATMTCMTVDTCSLIAVHLLLNAVVGSHQIEPIADNMWTQCHLGAPLRLASTPSCLLFQILLCAGSQIWSSLPNFKPLGSCFPISSLAWNACYLQVAIHYTCRWSEPAV